MEGNLLSHPSCTCGNGGFPGWTSLFIVHRFYGTERGLDSRQSCDWEWDMRIHVFPHHHSSVSLWLSHLHFPKAFLFPILCCLHLSANEVHLPNFVREGFSHSNGFSSSLQTIILIIFTWSDHIPRIQGLSVTRLPLNTRCRSRSPIFLINKLENRSSHPPPHFFF